MASYVVETYLPNVRFGELDELATDAHLGATRANREGATIRFLGAILLPEREICLLRFEAEQRDSVVAVMQQAGITYDRITSAVDAKGARAWRSRERRTARTC